MLILYGAEGHAPVEHLGSPALADQMYEGWVAGVFAVYRVFFASRSGLVHPQSDVF